MDRRGIEGVGLSKPHVPNGPTEISRILGLARLILWIPLQPTPNKRGLRVSFSSLFFNFFAALNKMEMINSELLRAKNTYPECSAFRSVPSGHWIGERTQVVLVRIVPISPLL